MIFWRISNHLSLEGDGAVRASGRWHTRGRRVVYAAPSPSAALLEILVHAEMNIRDLPARYRLLKIEVPAGVLLEHVAATQLPADWVARIELTRGIGDAWLTGDRSALLTVPSAVVPETDNVLLNPLTPMRDESSLPTSATTSSTRGCAGRDLFDRKRLRSDITRLRELLTYCHRIGPTREWIGTFITKNEAHEERERLQVSL